MQITPTSIDFGATFIGQTITVPATVTNTHSASVTFNVGGVDVPEFGSSNSCAGSLPAGASCSFNYSFTPSATGTVQTVSSVGSDATSPLSLYENTAITLKGTGVSTLSSPNVAVWPVGVDYGTIKVGRSVSTSVSYKHNSSAPVSFAGGGFNDSQGGTFYSSRGVSQTCGETMIASGATCNIAYAFWPHLAQAYTNSSSIEFSVPAGPSTVVPIAVSGTGSGDLARVSPRIIDLGNVAFGTQASVPVVITNTSDYWPLTNFIGGGMNLPFSSSTTCASPLAVGASCAYTYVFQAPSASSSLASSYGATTLLSFTNQSGIAPIVEILITAHVGDRIFGDGFED